LIYDFNDFSILKITWIKKLTRYPIVNDKQTLVENYVVSLNFEKFGTFCVSIYYSRNFVTAIQLININFRVSIP